MNPEWRDSEGRAGRADRMAGGADRRRQANRRLQIAAIFILGAALLVGSGAFASQSDGGQPFGGLLAEPSPGPAGPVDADPAPADDPAGPGGGGEASGEPAEGAAQGAGEGPPPSFDTTGVPDGLALQPFEGGAINQAGVTVTGLDVNGCLTINANDVTIRNTRITCDGPVAVQLAEGVTGVLLEAVEIDGAGNAQGIGVAPGDYTVRRADIHNIGEGLRAGSNTVVEDSLIHDLVPGGAGGIQSTGGTGIVIRGNLVDFRDARNPVIHIGATQANIGDALVEGNWLNGGVVTVAAGARPGFSAEGVQIVDNTFGRNHAQGPLDIQPNVVWEGNIYFDDGSEILP